jgi:hypothetical protein
MNELIEKLFKENWHGKETTKSLDNMKAQLYKNLNDQLNGYWSGSTAYYIMTKGGFLVDSKRPSKRKEKKQLTELGKMFMKEYEDEYNY